MATGKDWGRLASFVLSERERLDWSQHELAERMGMDVKTVRRIEARHSVWGTTLAALERAFDWQPGSARDILGGGVPRPRSESAGSDGPPWLINGELDLRDEVEREIWRITDLTEAERWAYIVRRRRERLTGQLRETGR